jgi:hypothetical protein
MAITSEPTRTGLEWLTAAEAHALFDEQARALLGISGEEFLQRWEAGEYRECTDDPDRPAIGHLASILPLAR